MKLVIQIPCLNEAETLAAEAASAMKVGDPFEQTTALGPLASAAQRDRVNGYIQKGIDEGAKVLVGGVGVPEGCGKGYYVKPTVFSNVKNSMTIAQEEIFGPVLSIIAYENEDDAVNIANDTVYGLSGGVWASTKEKGIAIARRIRTGGECEAVRPRARRGRRSSAGGPRARGRSPPPLPCLARSGPAPADRGQPTPPAPGTRETRLRRSPP